MPKHYFKWHWKILHLGLFENSMKKYFHAWNENYFYTAINSINHTCLCALNSIKIMYCCVSILAGIKPITATDTLQVSVHTSQLQNNTSSMCTKQWRAEHIRRQMTPPHVCFSMGRYMWSLTYCIRWHQNMRVSLLIPDVLSDVNRPQGRLFLLGIPPTIRHLSLPLKSPSLTHTTPDLSYNTHHWRPDLTSSSGSSKPLPIFVGLLRWHFAL